MYMHTDDTSGVSSTFNSRIIVTDDGVVVVDALGSDAIARQVREARTGRAGADDDDRVEGG
mgnify:CR=1 FL=1